MPKSRKTQTKKIKAPKLVRRVEEEFSFALPFHETFPFTLKHLKSTDKKVCYFECKEHMDKYIERSKMTKKEYKIEKTQPKDEEET